MTLAGRAASFLLDPPDRDRAPAADPFVSRAPARVVVLTPPEEAFGAACAVALSLAGSGVGVAASWGADGDVQPPAGALPTASRHATRLSERGFAAEPAGRLVRVRIEGDEAEAASAFERLSAACEMPVAVALAAPRRGAMSEVLARADKVVVAAGRGRPNGLVEAALAEARMRGHDAFVADLRAAGATRALLTLGYGLPPRMAAALRSGLR